MQAGVIRLWCGVKRMEAVVLGMEAGVIWKENGGRMV
jgi:hypothetical protein